jgi:hypothetical protein
MKRAEQVGSLLKQVLGAQGLADRLSRYQAWLIWDKLVGEQIAHRARPLRIRQGVLEVQVDHPVWMQQLQMLKPKILEKLNQQIPNAGITDIYLRRAQSLPPRLPPAPEAAPAKWREIELSPAELEQIEERAREIKDPELRQELKRLFRLQKQLDKSNGR